MSKTGFRVVFKPGTHDVKISGKSQPGFDLERALVDFVLVKGLATNPSGDCCTLVNTALNANQRLDTAAYSAWTASFTGSQISGVNDRRGETIFNLATQKLVCATWNGSAWVFNNLF